MRIKRTIVPSLLILAVGASLAAAAEGGQARLKVIADQANLREKPDIGSSIVQAIPEGTFLEADRKEGEWYFVRYTLEDGGVIGGWIHQSLVTVVEQAAAPAAKVTPAQPAARAPARERPRQPGTGGIRPPEFRTGAIPLEFSVSAGVATLAPHDLNDGTRGFVDRLAASTGLSVPQHADLLNLAGVIGFELAFRFSPRLTFGLGADYMKGSNEDRMTLEGALPETVSTKPSIRGVPVKAIVRFYPGPGLFIRGALGLYSARAGYFFRHENAEASEQWKGHASTTGLGAEAAFGGEWDLAPRTILFVEAGLRIASFSGLTGEDVYKNSANAQVVEAGTLFFFKETAGGETAYPQIFVRSALPAGPGVTSVRQARINLSGTAVRVGVRYRF